MHKLQIICKGGPAELLQQNFQKTRIIYFSVPNIYDILT